MIKILPRFLLVLLWLVMAKANANIVVNKIMVPADSLLQAKFSQLRYLNGIDMPIKSKGEFYLLQGKGLIWSTITPFPSTLVIKAKGIYRITNGDIKALTTTENDQTMLKIISAIMSGVFTAELEEVIVENITKSAKTGAWQARLTFTNPVIKNFIHYILVEGNQYITKIIITRIYGDKDIITVQEHKIIPQKLLSKKMQKQKLSWLYNE